MNNFMNQESTLSTKNASLRNWLFQSLAIGLLAVAVLGVFVFVRYGSLETALAAMNGQPLLADIKDQSFGELEIGQKIDQEIAIRNISEHPVQLVGAKSSCTCAVTENLPLSIPAGGRRKVKVTVKIKGEPGPWLQTVSLFTDSARESQLTLHLTGNILSRASGKR